MIESTTFTCMILFDCVVLKFCKKDAMYSGVEGGSQKFGISWKIFAVEERRLTSDEDRTLNPTGYKPNGLAARSFEAVGRRKTKQKAIRSTTIQRTTTTTKESIFFLYPSSTRLIEYTHHGSIKRRY